MLQRPDCLSPPQDVLRGAADEVLAVLKNKDLRDPERQRECVQLLGSCDDEMFARLVALGKRITDYVSEAEVGWGRVVVGKWLSRVVSCGSYVRNEVRGMALGISAQITCLELLLK